MIWKLFLDDERYPPQADGSWTIARNYHDAVWYVTNYGMPKFISFDHDLAYEHYLIGTIGDELGKPREFTGYDFAKWLCDYIATNDVRLPEGFNWYVHSMNPVGAKNIRDYLEHFFHNWYISEAE